MMQWEKENKTEKIQQGKRDWQSWDDGGRLEFLMGSG